MVSNYVLVIFRISVITVGLVIGMSLLVHPVVSPNRTFAAEHVPIPVWGAGLLLVTLIGAASMLTKNYRGVVATYLVQAFGWSLWGGCLLVPLFRGEPNALVAPPAAYLFVAEMNILGAVMAADSRRFREVVVEKVNGDD